MKLVGEEANLLSEVGDGHPFGLIIIFLLGVFLSFLFLSVRRVPGLQIKARIELPLANSSLTARLKKCVTLGRC